MGRRQSSRIRCFHSSKGPKAAMRLPIFVCLWIRLKPGSTNIQNSMATIKAR